MTSSLQYRWVIQLLFCCYAAALQAPIPHYLSRGMMNPHRKIQYSHSSAQNSVVDGGIIINRPRTSDTSNTQRHQHSPNDSSNNKEEDGFQQLIQKAVNTLIKSDTDGEELDHSTGSASQGLWIHAPAGKELKGVLDRVELQVRCATVITAMQLLLIVRLGLRFWFSVMGSIRQTAELHMNAEVVPDISGIAETTVPVDTSPEIEIDHNYTKPNLKEGNHSPNTNSTGPKIRIENDDLHDDKTDAFGTLVDAALETLIQSDVERPDGAATQGRWVYAPAAYNLQHVLDRLVIPQDISIDTSSLQNENVGQMIQFMKGCPSPMFLDLTTHIHDMITENHLSSTSPWITKEHLKKVDTTLAQYTSRIACHVILLPSGAETSPLSLVESTGSHIYGKLLYGGVTRFRLLKSGKTVRRAGEKREVMTHPNKKQQSQQQQYGHPSWVQLGGLERRYEGVDMGPAAVLEVTLLPRLWQDLPTIFDKNILMGGSCSDMTMTDVALGWDPSTMLHLLPEVVDKGEDDGDDASSGDESVLQTLEGSARTEALTSHFESRVGGLQPQIDSIVRRVLDGRSIYATTAGATNQARLEAEELSLLGLQPVRGLLLYGKPGVGKTLIVREIARLLTSVPPKIVSASDLLDRWVGGSERLVRELFKDAEDELKMCQMAADGDDDNAFLNSALHVIVIDEIDGVFRKRMDSDDSGTITRNSIVNQLLAKLDGVHALPNVLMIGMTNRKELLDPALLRPGRLEVQIEIPLPKRLQRREILQIHFAALRTRNRLSYPLRCAIDGVASNYSSNEMMADEVNPNRGRKRRALKRAAGFISTKDVYDLADETEGYSGADIEGLVRSAGSLALSRARKEGAGVGALLITLDDVKQALVEVKA